MELNLACDDVCHDAKITVAELYKRKRLDVNIGELRSCSLSNLEERRGNDEAVDDDYLTYLKHIIGDVVEEFEDDVIRESEKDSHSNNHDPQHEIFSSHESENDVMIERRNDTGSNDFNPQHGIFSSNESEDDIMMGKQNDTDCDDHDPQYRIFLSHVKRHGNSYALELKGEDGLGKLIEYEGEDGTSNEHDLAIERKMKNNMKRENARNGELSGSIQSEILVETPQHFPSVLKRGRKGSLIDMNETSSPPRSASRGKNDFLSPDLHSGKACASQSRLKSDMEHGLGKGNNIKSQRISKDLMRGEKMSVIDEDYQYFVNNIETASGLMGTPKLFPSVLDRGRNRSPIDKNKTSSSPRAASLRKNDFLSQNLPSDKNCASQSRLKSDMEHGLGKGTKIKSEIISKDLLKGAKMSVVDKDYQYFVDNIETASGLMGTPKPFPSVLERGRNRSPIDKNKTSSSSRSASVRKNDFLIQNLPSDKNCASQSRPKSDLEHGLGKVTKIKSERMSEDLMQGVKMSIVDKDYQYFLDNIVTASGLMILRLPNGDRVEYEKDLASRHRHSKVELIKVERFQSISPGDLDASVEEDSCQCLESPPETENAPFRREVMNYLRKPYDREEYKKLWHDFIIRKKITRHLELRGGREQSCETGAIGKSYLERHRDLRRIIKAVKGDKCKTLNILRGFFFWLKNLPREGVFRPWQDPECLAVMPGFRR